jgi:3-oxoacyl-[acyl-carrier protein] reductase
MTSYLDEDDKKKLIQNIPLNRLGSVNDIAELAIFLASEDASYITGQTISVDGGLFMY